MATLMNGKLLSGIQKHANVSVSGGTCLDVLDIDQVSVLMARNCVKLCLVQPERLGCI